jgi:hypothetical protein
VRFKEFAEQVAKFWEAECLDAESITEIKSKIARSPSSGLLVREKIVEAAHLALPSLPPTRGCHVRDPFPSQPPENKDER